MANLLYKLGQFSARRAWLVLISWFLILVSTAGLMVAFAGKLSTTMSLPGTPSQLVIDDLNKSFPVATNASGQVVIHKTNGAAFTEDEKGTIADLLAEVKSQASVSAVVNPFETEALLVKNRDELADAQAKEHRQPHGHDRQHGQQRSQAETQGNVSADTREQRTDGGHRRTQVQRDQNHGEHEPDGQPDHHPPSLSARRHQLAKL